MNAMPQLEVVFLYPGGFNGGGQNVVTELAQSLAENGWRVIILVPPGNPLLQKTNWRHDVQVVAMAFPLLRECKPLQLVRYYQRLLRFARDHHQAVFYGHSFQSLKHLALISSLAGGRTVLHLHESDCSMYHSLRARMLSRRIDAIIAISRFVKEQFVAGTNIDDASVKVVPTGVVVDPKLDKSPEQQRRLRKELGVAADGPLVTMVARADPLKGHLVLVQAAERVLKSVPDTIFLLVGMSDNTATEKHISTKVVACIRSRGLRNHFHILGFREDARRIVRYSDVAVVPSTAEGFGLTAIEALAEQTPLIATQVGGLAEIFKNDQEGLYIEPNNPEDLSRAILRLLSDKELGRTLSARGHVLAMQRYALPEMTHRVSAILQRTLEYRRTPAITD